MVGKRLQDTLSKGDHVGPVFQSLDLIKAFEQTLDLTEDQFLRRDTNALGDVEERLVAIRPIRYLNLPETSGRAPVQREVESG